ncbi:uncharacterized protein FIBRA_05729 [Fibroporia radiculosa]|uniref:Uncharacterized protein n=1 Tax=Fibroporia radiculosa TaxID=599839 RepID=J4HY10_9APHY|nr:uncharacterized protein FIBRA_05729 [Fibroporia radiculosa]CCM03592.1 predicted protein [Fibroporia radiculosa]
MSKFNIICFAIIKAMCPEEPFSGPAYQLVLFWCDCTTFEETSVRLFDPMIPNILASLGSQAAVLEAAGWTVRMTGKRIYEPVERKVAVDRLVSLVSKLARCGVVSLHDAPDFMLSMFFIALDRSTSAELRSHIIVAIELLGQTLSGSGDGPIDIEVSVCSKILQFAKDLSPLNRAYLLSLMPGGCPSTGRIVRWLANCLLLNTDMPSPASYKSLPPLSPIVDLLSPPTGSGDLFDIIGNLETVNYYDDLVCHIDILSKVLNDVEAYVALENGIRLEAASTEVAESESTSPQKGSSSREAPPTRLEQIKAVLDGLHGKIVDTRAAHLDRSRAKAALQRLSFRLYYQRTASLRSGKPRNLHGYFGQSRK